MKFLSLLIVTLFISTPAYADEDFFKLTSFLKAVKNRDYVGAESYVSARSVPYLKRYAAHDVAVILPEEVNVLKSYEQNSYRYLQVVTTQTANRQPKATTVAFVTENNSPKIDIPETLRNGFGNNWEQQVNAIEQTYTATKQYFGEEKAKQAVTTLLNRRPAPAAQAAPAAQPSQSPFKKAQ